MNLGKELKKTNLLSWPTLLVGYENGWISKEDIENYAIFLLEKSDNFDTNLALLADAGRYNEEEIQKFILSQIDGSIISEEEIKKFELAALLGIKESNLKNEEKCSKLQDLYAEFNYPEKMKEFSIYSPSNKAPLEAMDEIIKSLEIKYHSY